MLIGVLKEAQPGETRVAATPETVGKLRGLGYEVAVEPGAGLLSGFFDQAYADAGATVGSVAEADIVFGVNAPSGRSRWMCCRRWRISRGIGRWWRRRIRSGGSSPGR